MKPEETNKENQVEASGDEEENEREKNENVENVKGQDPLNIFPEELWKLIFNCLAHDPEALLACSKATPKFTNALKKSEKYFRFHEIFPLIRKYLSFKDTLNLRLAHSSYKMSVNKYYQDFDSHAKSDVYWDADKDTIVYFKALLTDMENQQRQRPPAAAGAPRKRILHNGPFTSNPAYYKTLRDSLYCFVKCEDFRKFFGSMPATNGNPFMTRCVQLNTCGSIVRGLENENNTWCEAFDGLTDQLLQNYGAFVHYFILDDRKLPHVEVYTLIHKILQYMPNLKILSVGPDQTPVFSEALPSPPQMPPTFMISTLPLQRTESITVLKLRFVPVLILLELLRKCPQLAKLEITYAHATLGIGCPCCDPGPRLDHSTLAIVNNEVLPKVKELYLIYKYPASGNEPYMKLNCPSLEIITFAFETKLKTLISETTMYRETMKTLTAFLDEKGISECNLQFDLPKLENLELRMCVRPTFPSLDFIAPLKSVKKLHLVFGGWMAEDEIGKVAENANEGLKISGLFHRMYESNIWEILPNLRRLSLEMVFPISFQRNNNLPDTPSKRWEYYRADLPKTTK